MALEIAVAPARAAASRRVRTPAAALDDEQLAGLVAGGDEFGLTALFERYNDGLYRYCRSLLRRDEDARDAMQETFVRAIHALRRDRRDAPLRPWLFRIAHNESMNILRRRARTVGEGQEVAADAPDVADGVQSRAELAALVEDLAALTERQRSALVMRELSGLSHAEIGLALGVNTNAAKQAIFEARAVLHAFATGRSLACEHLETLIAAGDGRRLRAKTVRSHLRHCAPCGELHRTAMPQRSRALALLTLLLPARATRWLTAWLGTPALAGTAKVAAVAALAGSAAGLLPEHVSLPAPRQAVHHARQVAPAVIAALHAQAAGRPALHATAPARLARIRKLREPTPVERTAAAGPRPAASKSTPAPALSPAVPVPAPGTTTTGQDGGAPGQPAPPDPDAGTGGQNAEAGDGPAPAGATDPVPPAETGSSSTDTKPAGPPDTTGNGNGNGHQGPGNGSEHGQHDQSGQQGPPDAPKPKKDDAPKDKGQGKGPPPPG